MRSTPNINGLSNEIVQLKSKAFLIEITARAFAKMKQSNAGAEGAGLTGLERCKCVTH